MSLDARHLRLRPGRDWDRPGRLRAAWRTSSGSGIMQLALAGKLDVATALQAGRALRTSQGQADLVVLDLREVQFVGCTAVRVVLMADARARRIGGRLVILATRASAPQLFALARLHRRLEIVERFPGARVEGRPLGPRPATGCDTSPGCSRMISHEGTAGGVWRSIRAAPPDFWSLPLSHAIQKAGVPPQMSAPSGRPSTRRLHFRAAAPPRDLTRVSTGCFDQRTSR